MVYSDHAPFWFNGYSAICGITDNEGFCGQGGNYPFYHQSSDTIANCGTGAPAFEAAAIRTYPSTTMVNVGNWRAVTNIPEAFGHECFLDELAAAQGPDPDHIGDEVNLGRDVGCYAGLPGQGAALAGRQIAQMKRPYLYAHQPPNLVSHSRAHSSHLSFSAFVYGYSQAGAGGAFEGDVAGAPEERLA